MLRMAKKIQPKSVEKIFCIKCKELLVKIYPYAVIAVRLTATEKVCGKCLNNRK